MAGAQREAGELSLLMLDADLFKRFNDQFGHQAGDTALQHVASAIASFARRPADCAARYGGEEFVLLLPGTRHAAALGIAEQIRAQVEATVTPRTTVSVGVAMQRAAPGHDAELIALADAALYMAKRGGRNCVCSRVAPDPIPARNVRRA